MTKKFNNLILTKDTVFNESIEVKGDIICKNRKWNLVVEGNIKAWDIKAWNIDAWNIEARDIKARNINARDIKAWNIEAWDIKARNINARDIKAWDIEAWDIKAWDIKAWDIICERRIKKTKNSKTLARIFITGKSKLKRKEWK